MCPQSSQVKTIDGPSPAQTEAERVTEQYGLEAGLVNVLTSKGEPDAPLSRTEQAKRLLAQYGSAYLLTSISFAIVSFAACYAAVSAGTSPHRTALHAAPFCSAHCTLQHPSIPLPILPYPAPAICDLHISALHCNSTAVQLQSSLMKPSSFVSLGLTMH
jgi:hypothetical protein